MPNRILIVDDEKLVLAGFKTALELEGYRVWTSQNAKAALALVQEASFDLIVLDFIMPGMDGLELLARIRNPSHLCDPSSFRKATWWRAIRGRPHQNTRRTSRSRPLPPQTRL